MGSKVQTQGASIQFVMDNNKIRFRQEIFVFIVPKSMCVGLMNSLGETYLSSPVLSRLSISAVTSAISSFSCCKQKIKNTKIRKMRIFIFELGGHDSYRNNGIHCSNYDWSTRKHASSRHAKLFLFLEKKRGHTELLTTTATTTTVATPQIQMDVVVHLLCDSCYRGYRRRNACTRRSIVCYYVVPARRSSRIVTDWTMKPEAYHYHYHHRHYPFYFGRRHVSWVTSKIQSTVTLTTTTHSYRHRLPEVELVQPPPTLWHWHWHWRRIRFCSCGAGGATTISTISISHPPIRVVEESRGSLSDECASDQTWTLRRSFDELTRSSLSNGKSRGFCCVDCAATNRTSLRYLRHLRRFRRSYGSTDHQMSSSSSQRLTHSNWNKSKLSSDC